jgi:uncharacterized protein
MKNIFLLFFLMIFIVSCETNSIPNVEIKINKKIYSFEVAATEKARQKGLMYRKSMGKDKGMLFVYEKKEILYYYMKNTFIPLDIAFIDDEYKIVDIQKMEPLDETTIESKDKAMYALETNRGFFDRVGLKIGDKLEFVTPIPYFRK